LGKQTAEKTLSHRIIPHIESLGEAVRVVRDVESGYHSLIEENISYWWAVEEDIIDSYTKLINRADDEKVRSALSEIIPDLRAHIEVLESMRESFKKILADVQRHGKMLQALYFDEELKQHPGKDSELVEEHQPTRGSAMPLAFVMMTAEAGREADVLDELKKIEHVKEACLTYGVYDVVARIEAETSDKLKDIVVSKVRCLDNVKSTLTMMVVE
jgi:DNA-binding Lrp family transcriptional regulator